MIYVVELGEVKDMLLAKYESIRNGIWGKSKLPEWTTSLNEKVEEEWVSYLNGIDCTIVTDLDIRDDFADIVNYSAQGRVCIDMEDCDPHLMPFMETTPFILMDKELFQKVVVLGSLPDHWSPEKK